MITVATEDFELYHGVVEELRDRGVPFTTVEPGDPLPAETRVVVVGPGDDPAAVREAGDPEAGRGDAEGDRAGATGGTGQGDTEGTSRGDTERDRAGEAAPGTPYVVVGDPDRPRQVVERALAELRAGGGRTVVGVDPGTRPGVAVLSGDVVVAVFQVPVEDAADLVRAEVEGAVDPVVRVGDGARMQGNRILEDLPEVRVELVDETGTTPHLGTGARGMGDVLAAVNIARLEGEPVANRSIEPTQGELQVVKNRSRERSGGERAITDELARAVAVGELTLDEALAAHENDDGGRTGDDEAEAGSEDEPRDGSEDETRDGSEDETRDGSEDEPRDGSESGE